MTVRPKKAQLTADNLIAAPLAAALALLGRLDEARTAAKAGLALDPAFTIRRFQRQLSSDNPTYLAKRGRVYEGMRLAGVPEG